MGFGKVLTMKYKKSYIKKVADWYNNDSNDDYLARHPELETIEMPETFYFKIHPHSNQIHWAIIKQVDNIVNIYFINNWGRVFDKLEFKNVKIARRRLRQNGFDFSTNRYCPFTPPKPVYIQLSWGKKSAPYSKGNHWKSIQRNTKHINKLENGFIKAVIEGYERFHFIRNNLEFYIQPRAKHNNSKGYLLLFLIFVIVLACYSLFVEPNMLEVNRYKIKDTQLAGVKVVFASDFHIKPYQQKRLRKSVELINSQNPDLVLSVGDFVSGHNAKMTMPIENIAKELGNIKSKYGFYTTLGNHDSWHGTKLISESLEKYGIKVLANENTSVMVNGKTIYIAGIEDLMTGNPDIYKALEGTKTPTILLTHSPDMFPKVHYPINLTLSGHTHGGQIRIPFFGPIFTASRYGNKYASGLAVFKNGNKMITTKGIGTSILPIRFNCMPEIVVIEFE